MYLAQLNVAQAKAPLDHTSMQEFSDNLEPINQLAESSDGFIWRLTDDSESAAHVEAFSDPKLLVNMSVWSSVDALKQFMFKTHHLGFMQRKQLWFDKLPQANHVLWWVPEGHRPDLNEGWRRLKHLRDEGETAFAFTFRSKFTEADINPELRPSSELTAVV